MSNLGIVGLGMASGLVPCWDAVGLLVLAAALGRLATGVALVIAFSGGMAAVLVAVAWLAGKMKSATNGLTTRRSGSDGLVWLAVSCSRRSACISSSSEAKSMSIPTLKLFKVAVPLKKVVRHASFERSVSENLVVRVTLSDGVVGYGEGVPRSYVTGETLETAFAALETQDWARIIGRPSSFAEVVERVKALTLPEIESDPRGMAGNAARCALELAVLDAYGRRFNESVGRAIELAACRGPRTFSQAPAGSLQWRDHRRIDPRRA